MQLIEDLNVFSNKINSYTKNSIVINDKLYTTSVIICPEQIFALGQIGLSSVSLEHILPITNYKPDILLIGTQDNLVKFDNDIKAKLQTNNIGIEIMPRGSAARTYMALLSESRSCCVMMLN